MRRGRRRRRIEGPSATMLRTKSRRRLGLSSVWSGATYGLRKATLMRAVAGGTRILASRICRSLRLVDVTSNSWTGFAIEANFGARVFVADVLGIDLDLDLVVAGVKEVSLPAVAFGEERAAAVGFFAGTAANAEALRGEHLWAGPFRE